MSKKGENIYKRKDGRWEGRYIRLRNIGGKAEYGYIYGKSYAEVKKKLMNAKVAVQLHAETREKKVMEILLLLPMETVQYSRDQSHHNY